MKFRLETETPNNLNTSCIVVPIFEENKLSKAASSLDQVTNGAISEVLKTGDLGTDLSDTLMLHYLPNLSSTRVLLIQSGKPQGIEETSYLKLIKTTASALKSLKISEAHLALQEISVENADAQWQIRQLVSQFEDVFYRFKECKSKPKEEDSNTIELESLAILIDPDHQSLAEAGLNEGQAIALGKTLCKNLANRPGNICTPTHLAEQALDLDTAYTTISTSVLEENEMEALGMGSFLSVSRGSQEPAKLVSIEYNGGQAGDAPYLFVGKGITFDTGGISLKPGPGMDEMKFDMGGAASVLGLMKTVAEMELPLNVVGVLACAENMPSGIATKPGDIVTTMSGKTVEILNTDAEGRLVLCDTLTYALEKYKPQCTLDIATLTGACLMALGNHASGLFTEDEELAADILAAGELSHDKAWRLPLWDEYQEQLDSNFADIANIGGRVGGAITAACFLSRFTEGYRWAHLDIAGTAWAQGKNKGSTGRPVAMLSQFLLNEV